MPPSWNPFKPEPEPVPEPVPIPSPPPLPPHRVRSNRALAIVQISTGTAPMSDVNKLQVGGDHYKNLDPAPGIVSLLGTWGTWMATSSNTLPVPGTRTASRTYARRSTT
jgi:hypothetical protein